MYENGRNSTRSAFLLRDKVNGKLFDVVPEYTFSERQNNRLRFQNCFPLPNGNEQCQVDLESPSLLRHVVFLGNTMVNGKDNSVVVGLPYAWIGETYDAAFAFGEERRIGTIGKIEFGPNGPKLVVPKNQEYEEVIGLQTKGGSIWGSKESRVSTPSNPVRHLYAGTSISKGQFFLSSFIKMYHCKKIIGIKFSS